MVYKELRYFWWLFTSSTMKSSVKRGRITAKSHSRLFFGVSRSDLSVLHDITKPEFHSKPTSFVCMFCLAISGLKGIPFFMLL